MGTFGLTLANRGVIIGAVTVPELFDMAKRGEDSGAFDAVWVGDSLLAKPRLESITLLSALAAVTKKVRLAVGCMATFPHRHPALLAQQWASLDVISGGRAWLAVCLGGPNEQSPAQALEHKVMGIKDTERVARLEEGITILRKLFHEEKASHKGRFYEFEGVTIQPRPVQNPMPIWIASNPTGLTWKDGASAPSPAVERGLRRVARFADGWMTNKVTPAGIHIAVDAHPGDGTRGRTRPGKDRQRPVSQHYHQRRPKSRVGREQSVSRQILHLQLQHEIRRRLHHGGKP